MGWTPRPRFDASRNQWFLRFKTTVIGPDGEPQAKSKHYLCTGRHNEHQAYAIARSILGDRSEPAPIDTIADAIDASLRAHPSKWRDSLLKTWFAYAGLTQLTKLPRHHLKLYRDWLQREGYTVPVRKGRGLKRERRAYTAQTIRHKIVAARQVLEFAHERGCIDEIPPMPKMDKAACTPEHYDTEELVETWRSLPKHAKRILTFILETGCRPSEAIALRWEQIKPRRGPHGECHIRVHKTSRRTATTRMLILTSGAAQVLAKIGYQPDGPVFLSARGTPYHNAGSLRSTLRRHGLPSVYQLRHTFAQRAYDAGAEILDVAALLGHKDLRMALRYVRARSDRLHRVAANLSSPLSALPDAEPEPKPSRQQSSVGRRRAPAQAGRRKPGRSGTARRRRA
jgi:integrase